METVSLSLVVLTYNEEPNLEHCLESVEGVTDRIFVVDSGSTDRTRDIAARYADRVVEHPFENQAQQFNWALDALPVDTEWVLRLDADEYLLPDLTSEIRSRLPAAPDEVSGFYLKRRVYFKGRWIRHGGYYPTWLLRLFRYGEGRSERLGMDEHIVVEGDTRRLEHDFVDHNRKDLSFWTTKHEGFAEREARVLLTMERGGEAGEIEGELDGDPPAQRRWAKHNLYLRTPPFLRAFLYFLYRYFLRGGILDGREGLVFHVLQGFWYRFYVDAKLWELKLENEENDAD